MFDLFDEICAEVLDIPVNEYIEKVEKLSKYKQEIIIGNLLELDIKSNKLKEKKLLKLKRIFNSL